MPFSSPSRRHRFAPPRADGPPASVSPTSAGLRMDAWHRTRQRRTGPAHTRTGALRRPVHYDDFITSVRDRGVPREEAEMSLVGEQNGMALVVELVADAGVVLELVVALVMYRRWARLKEARRRLGSRVRQAAQRAPVPEGAPADDIGNAHGEQPAGIGLGHLLRGRQPL